MYGCALHPGPSVVPARSAYPVEQEEKQINHRLYYLPDATVLALEIPMRWIDVFRLPDRLQQPSLTQVVLLTRDVADYRERLLWSVMLFLRTSPRPRWRLRVVVGDVAEAADRSTTVDAYVDAIGSHLRGRGRRRR